MTIERAIENLQVLGWNYARSLENIGKPVPDLSPLFHGLAAYEILNLKGVYAWLDESVRVVLMEVLHEVKRGMH
jgi:hypothetical protein